MRGDLAYFNYGGDKLWPTVQALWGRAFGGGNWPPDGVIDGEPWTVVERGARHVMLRSAVSPDLGVVAERRIELVEDRPAVHLRNRLTRVQRNPFPVHLWTVTQVQTPPAVMLDVAADRPAVQGLWDPFGKPQAFAPDNPQVLGEKAALYWQLNPGEHRKVGTFGRWVAGLYPDLIFLQQTTFDPQGAYPDRSSAQVYNDANLTELELLSPMVHLQPGQTLENHVVWQLLPGSAGERPDETLERITAAVAATALEPDRVIRHGAGGLGP
jgi:hypothetical protein